MTKENLKRLQERISNLIENTNASGSYKLWDQGYNSACEQILEMIEEIEKEEL